MRNSNAGVHSFCRQCERTRPQDGLTKKNNVLLQFVPTLPERLEIQQGLPV
jgi:hypothetical protein